MLRKKLLIFCVLVLATGGRAFCQSGAYPLAGAPSSVPTGILLTAAPQAGEVSSGLGAVRWDAGTIPGSRATLEHTFKLKNLTAHAVTVSHLRGSCGCETLFLAKGGKESPSATLAPGEAADVRVSVALHPGQSGEMHKFAWAYGPNAAAPALASMEIVLNVLPAIVYDPPVLDFGSLMVGDVRSVTVSVTADAGVLAGKPLPTPVGSDPTIAVVPDGAETGAMQDGKPARTRRFRVTLAAPAEAGPVSGSVALPPSAPAVLSAVSLPLAGTISGTLTAQPKSVFFGSVPVGLGVVREVMLSEAAAQRGKSLTVTSGSPWITVHIEEQAGTNPVLRLSVKPGTPVGPLQTQVVVVSASGERLTVPVVGEIIRPGT